jgi:hypothetical protein
MATGEMPRRTASARANTRPTTAKRRASERRTGSALTPDVRSPTANSTNCGDDLAVTPKRGSMPTRRCDTTHAPIAAHRPRPSTTSTPSAAPSTMAARTSPLLAVRATPRSTPQGCFCCYTGAPPAAATQCASAPDRDPRAVGDARCELPAFHARALTFTLRRRPALIGGRRALPSSRRRAKGSGESPPLSNSRDTRSRRVPWGTPPCPRQCKRAPR